MLAQEGAANAAAIYSKNELTQVADMDFGNTTIFKLSKAKMAYLGQRQAVLAQNIANADTPGYRAKDVKEPSFASMVSGKSMGSGALKKTHAMHMGGGSIGNGSFKVIERREISENNPNRNSVNLDNEIPKVAFTQSEYDKVVSIYRKNISLIRTAIGNPNA